MGALLWSASQGLISSNHAPKREICAQHNRLDKTVGSTNMQALPHKITGSGPKFLLIN